MTRRPGLTMTEVLVSLFVMALGTIAILTMFPLGMLNMGQALKDDRTSQAASSADGYLRWYWKTFVVESNPTSDTFLSPGANCAFDNPGGGLPALTAANATEASYPVVVDPIGAWARGSGASVSWIGSSTVPRVNLSQITSSGQALRTCTQLDGFTYDQNGLPDLTGGSVQRDMRYNWLWVLQRPVDRNTTTVTMTVVVFDRRAPLYVPPNAEATIPGVAMTPGTTSFSLSALNGAVIQKGTWVMDATVSGTIRHAKFYRVVSATQNASNGLDVELESPIQRIDGNTTSYSGTIVVPAGVADVYFRPSLTAGQ
ncbi:MAG: hypothetical protein JWO38_8046 [Gemmataceae bacterium]|nr:hypothetical protein [Gemmataceae bacterium]